MRDHESLKRPVVVSLPTEIDIANADDVGEQLRVAFAPGVTVVIADLSSTVFCDAAGARQLLMAHKRAVLSNRELLLVVSSANVRRLLAILEFDRVLRIHPDLASALATRQPPNGH